MGSKLAALALLGALVSPAAAAPLLHPMFQDHAVLQRGGPIPVYGEAAPGAEVSVKLGSASARAKADASGRWQVSLPPMPAGGPYTLEARAGGQVDAAHDVLVGDVFLCSGQSNMAFEVRGAENAAGEIASAHDDAIRSLTIADKDSLVPLARFADPVQWRATTPETVGRFSAACYFFARELKASTHAPVGMVTAAWGGSRVRSWTGEAALRRTGLYDGDLALLDRYRTDPQAAERGWDETWERWWRGLGETGAPPWDPAFQPAGWATAPAALGPWALWTGTSPDGFTGQMWLRTEVSLTAEQAAKPAELDLGVVNEEDESWVNGHGVGATSWSHDARHVIPSGVLHAGRNTVVTNIFCSWRNCGLTGPAQARAIRFADGGSVPLDGPWRYHEMKPDEIAPQLPWGPAHGDAVIYNGMIAPIGPYGFKAALWYQGESDIHFAPQYQATLTAMMQDWRGRFGAALPFLVVQLPNVGPFPTRPVESGYADVREAQRRAVVADPHAGDIVTIDLGDPRSLHPVDKQDVGVRLAQAMRRLAFDEAEPTGPRPEMAMRQGPTVRVRFKGVSGSLVSYSGAPTAFELCGQSAGSCRFVPARLDGPDAVALAVDAGEAPARVRYCWGDSPVCTLSDGSGLPAIPFELPLR
jgi:sialate O-acetylesterase